MSDESIEVPAIVKQMDDSNEEDVDDNDLEKNDPAGLTRNASFKERQNFADAEESEGSPRTSAKIRAQRKRLGSRSSRQNSNSERSFRAGSTSPFVDPDSTEDEAEPVPADSTEDDDVVTKKRRPKRKRHVDESEKALKVKLMEIDRALTSTENEVERLRELASSDGGLLDDDIRRKAWPRLVNIRMLQTEILPIQEECEMHKEYNQVVLDVDRSLKRFPPGIKEEQRPGLQDQLTRLIVRVLLKHPDLHYYQGYHDVAITFLLVVGEEMGFHIMERLSISHLRDFMAPTMEKTTFQLNYMYPMINREHPELFDFLESSEVGTIFALPWMITWFGHVLPNYEDVVRLYDFFLAKPPMMPVYLATALVLHREQEILMSECDLAMVHSLLSRIPVDLPFEKLLVDAQDLYDQHPPKTLEYEVKQRMKKIQEQNRPPVKKKKKSILGFSPVIGMLVLTAPIFVGLVAWRWYNHV